MYEAVSVHRCAVAQCRGGGVRDEGQGRVSVCSAPLGGAKILVAAGEQRDVQCAGTAGVCQGATPHHAGHTHQAAAH